MSTNSWRWYLAAVVLVTQYYFVSAVGAAPDSTLYTAIGVGSLVVLVGGIGVQLRKQSFAWALVAVGVGLFLAGDVVYAQLAAEQAFVPFPSTADWLYLAMYPVLSLGLVIVGRSERTRTTWAAPLAGLGAAVVASGVLHVSYMGDYVAEPFFDTEMRIVAVAYPALDAVLIGLAVWLLVIGGRRAVSLSLAAAALVSLVIGNTVYNVQSIDGSFASGGLADLGWIAFVALLATAGLHPVASLSAATSSAATTHDVEHAVQSEPHDGNAPVPRDVAPSDDVFAEIDRLILRDKQRDSVRSAEHVTRT